MKDKSVVPPKLYKYTQFSGHSENNLINNALYLSYPIKFNDPFDCDIPYILVEPSENDLILTAKEMNIDIKQIINNKSGYKTSAENIVVKKNNNFQQMGIVCFAEEKDNKLLWAHYADGHKGFCLEFDTNNYPFHTDTLYKVNYSQEYPTKPYTSVYLGNVWLDAVITKSIDWEYEHEWRIIADKGDQYEYYSPDTLTGIYFGLNMDDKNKERIISMDFAKNTKFYQMKRHNQKFSLFPEEIITR